MKSTKSAIRYAKSLLELSVEAKSTEKVAGDMQTLADAYNESRDFQLFVSSPIINAEKKLSIFDKIFPNFDKLSMDFIRLVTNHKRESQIGEIANAYVKLLRDEQGISEVTLTSAMPLDEATKNTIVSKIKGVTKEKIELKEVIDENLIGGFMIDIDDKRIDASVVNQLRTIKQRLTI